MKKTILILLLGLTVPILLTYGKFEYNSYLYLQEFLKPIETEIKQPNTYLFGTPQKIKVINYTKETANLFLKDEKGNKWMLNFKKDSTNRWILRYDNKLHTEIIDSEQGGSADKLYWY